MLHSLISIKKRKSGKYRDLSLNILNIEVFNAYYGYEGTNIHICKLYCNKFFRHWGLCTYVISYIKN